MLSRVSMDTLTFKTISIPNHVQVDHVNAEYGQLQQLLKQQATAHSAEVAKHAESASISAATAAATEAELQRLRQWLSRERESVQAVQVGDGRDRGTNRGGMGVVRR